MITRRALLTYGFMAALGSLTACTQDPGLRALQGDPMASWAPNGMVSEDRDEQGASQQSGFSSAPGLSRRIHMDSADAAESAAIQAKDVATSYGWKAIPDSPFLGKSLDGGFSGEFYVSISEKDANALIISLSC